MSDKPYFHEEFSDKAAWEAFVRSTPGTTWADVQERYAQPPWCNHPDALNGAMGCWSLVGAMVTGEDYCKGCDCHKEAPGG